jgi:anti-sigma factor RsiW
MRRNENFVTDAELHAYVNDELDEVRRIYVEAYLVRHPHELEKIQKFREQNSGLHHLTDVVLKDPVQEIPELSEPKKVDWLYLPRVFKVAIVGGFMTMIITVGWIAHAQWGNSSDGWGLDFVHLLRPATFAHNMYSTDPEYPVEFKANKKELLGFWLSDRMNASIWAPQLNNLGYKLIGGRLIPSTNRMAAQFMYENSDRERITIYVRRDDWGARETQIQYRGLDGVKTYFWSTGEMGYAVVGTIDKAQLVIAARQVSDIFSDI